eukprot:928691_1
MLPTNMVVPKSADRNPNRSSKLSRPSRTNAGRRTSLVRQMSGQNLSLSTIVRYVTGHSIKSKQNPSSTDTGQYSDSDVDAEYDSIKRNGRIVIHLDTPEAPQLATYLIAPDACVRYIWDLALAYLVLYYAAATPINMAFDKSPFDIPFLEIVFNAFFVLDIILQFFSTYYIETGPKQGRLETSHTRVIRRYLRGWFIIDVLASCPFDLIMLHTTGHTSGFNLRTVKTIRLTRSLKLMRLFRISRIYKRLEKKIRITVSITRIIKMMITMFIVWHWIACSYWMVCVTEDSFIPDHYSEHKEFDYGWAPFQSLQQDATFLEQYNIAYFWAVQATTGIGKDIAPTTQLQHSFTTLVIITGVCLYATIIGSVGTALTSIDTPYAQKKRTIDSVKEYFHQRGINEELTNKVVAYYDYCYDRHITRYDSSILHDIHPTLKEQLQLASNKRLLYKVQAFQCLPEAIVLMLIHSLESRIYLPSEIVYLVGEAANEMFFVARGDLKELNHMGQVMQYYSDGQCFGAEFVQLKARRGATVSSLGHSELLVLSQITMSKVSDKYPEFALSIFKWSHEARWNAMSYWERIRYAIQTQKMISRYNVPVKFLGTYQHLNGFNAQAKSKRKSRTVNLRKARMSVLDSSVVSYADFNDIYKKYYTTNFAKQAQEAASVNQMSTSPPCTEKKPTRRASLIDKPISLQALGQICEE